MPESISQGLAALITGSDQFHLNDDHWTSPDALNVLLTTTSSPYV